MNYIRVNGGYGGITVHMPINGTTTLTGTVTPKGLGIGVDVNF